MPHRFNRASGKGLPDPPHAFVPAKVLLSGALALACLTVHAAQGQVFRWHDARGQVHYGDRPAPGADRLPLAADAVQTPALSGRVAKVYDGDTIELDSGDKIRLLGINTPEVAHRGRRTEAGAEEAKAWLAGKLAGRTVCLEFDATPRDKYGRRLAHVFLADGTHINLALIREGLATTDIFPPDLKYVNVMLEAEREAQRANRGLWSMAAYQPRPASGAREESGWQRLVGDVASTIAGRGQTRLVLRDRLEIRIPGKDLHLFPSIRSYLGRRVEVRGWVAYRKGKLSVTVRHPSALVRLD